MPWTTLAMEGKEERRSYVMLFMPDIDDMYNETYV